MSVPDPIEFKIRSAIAMGVGLLAWVLLYVAIEMNLKVAVYFAFATGVAAWLYAAVALVMWYQARRERRENGGGGA